MNLKIYLQISKKQEFFIHSFGSKHGIKTTNKQHRIRESKEISVVSLFFISNIQ